MRRKQYRDHRFEQHGAALKSIPPDELIHIIQYWLNQDWPLTEQQAKQACRNLDWTENEEGNFNTPYDFKINIASLGVNLENRQLSLASFWISDVLHEESREREFLLNDLFTRYVNTLKATWGKPKLSRNKNSHEASWLTLFKGCRVDIAKRKASLSCYIYSPEYAEVERYLSQRGL
ncbi:hypothetical protein EII34_14270 [Arachnia propionica]|uniref:Uncharacterized protein n=1 Tax=Arachnia propionica TaxID=1750 RepID=A0A3P1T215_9ACTN|nr:DUF6301 family protein [Arachnia propionica]RRD03450.1 hypothetical protein EII34_14270 [Arachnia propionica]